MNPISIAMSGMQAASLRLNASASNVANLRTNGRLPPAGGTSAAPAAYAPLRVDQVEVSGGGTAANVSTASPSYTPSYDPTASYADGNGMVAAPNVDLANEAVQQITAKYEFAASAAIMRAASDMTKTLLDRTA
jgi:flagellar basal-body rod protein FlgC